MPSIKKKCLLSTNQRSVILPFIDKLYNHECFVYVIARARGQLRINFTQNCPSLEEARAIWKTLKMQVKLILNCLGALAITCLPHKGQNSVQRKTFKVLPSRKQACRLSLKNRLAVEWGKPSTIVGKTQQDQFTQSHFFTNKL